MTIKDEINKRIFRENDIRGEYPKDIDEDTAYTIGLGVGTSLLKLGHNKCVVGHDNRLSAEVLTNALIKGLTETGVNVVYINLVTTPMLNYACLYLKIESGVMVTASHNPVNDNGFKITLDNYDNACGQAIYDLRDLIESKEFAHGTGSIETFDIKEAYVENALKHIHLNKKMKVVVDPANASGCVVVKDIFDNVDNLEAIYINDYSDGHFPSHHPDPLIPENMEQLSAKVKEVGADLGVALDGDADRVGIVDETGKMLNIDTLMAIICGDMIPVATNKTILFDVKCSKQLEDEIIRLGGIPYLYRNGSAFVENKIKELNIMFGGELTGHLFFRDKYDGFDDGIYCGLRVLELLSNKNEKLSTLDDNLPHYYNTPEIKVATTDDKKFQIVEKVKAYVEEKGYDKITIDGVRVKFEDGWALVRASNTGPNITTRFEATTEERLDEIKNEFLTLVEKYNV